MYKNIEKMTKELATEIVYNRLKMFAYITSRTH